MSRRSDTFLVNLAVVVVLAVILFAIPALGGWLAYGDWTCGFAHCVKVKR